MNTKDRILIPGGAGMLATAFKRLLPNARFVSRAELDVADEKAVAAMFASFKPTLVLNCSAYTKVDLAEQHEQAATAVNGHAVGTLARLSREHGAMLVHFSTDYVFDGTLRRPLKPDDPVGPQSAYGRSKLLGEQLLQQNAPDKWLILRTAWLYGPGGPNFPQAILNAARAGKPLNVVDDQIGSPTFTFDLAQATLDLIDRGATGIYHVVNDGQTNWHDFARAILDEFKIEANLSRTTSAEWKKTRPASATRPSYSVLDLAPFQQTVGHRPRGWLDALREYAKIP